MDRREIMCFVNSETAVDEITECKAVTWFPLVTIVLWCFSQLDGMEKD